MADIVAKARAKRQHLLAELQKVDTFLGVAAELDAEDAPSPAASPAPAQAQAAAPAAAQQQSNQDGAPPRQRSVPKTGVVRQTGDVIRDHMRAYGEGLKTRDLVPIVENAGIVIAGKDKVATLSARIHTSQMFERRGSQWFIRQRENEEATDSPTKDPSAASLFNSNQGAP